MHTFIREIKDHVGVPDGRTARIHHNSDMSGDVVLSVVTATGNIETRLTFPAHVIVAFAAELVRMERTEAIAKASDLAILRGAV